ncbi:SDR family oxidoreductase [Actinoplanes sp. N902-109]|uniref:SDR family oxidoreductase n=1 Tax=Actinoplanes sp. (strain N902-109) TaxID=649831 RepID=UPI0003293568|nr:SDR family oxidoreductase [Actinoplanes sp. N902-109]AGL18077.1 oxidoreductase [Actinoplanes sp. N902-109]
MPKVIAITGASSGIGEATAVRLSAAGHRLVLGARREDRLAALAERLPGEVATLRTDVTDRADVNALVALATSRFGRLDVLVANAGVATVEPLDTLSVDRWDEMIDINIKGFLYGVAAALPVFRAQDSGHFVTTVSTSGLRVVPGQVVYAGTKNAVRTMCEGLRQEAGPAIRVTAISPGYVNTEFAEATADPANLDEIRRNKRDLGLDPDAVARTVAYAIDQPADVDINEITIRPTAQS